MLQKKRLDQCMNILADLLEEMEGGEVDHIYEEMSEIATQCCLFSDQIDSILARTNYNRTKEGGAE
jgi:hypothetical protein